MTPAEIAIIDALKKVSFPMYSSRASFAQRMIDLRNRDEAAKLTLKQRQYLVQLAVQFRRQISNIAELIGAIHSEDIAPQPSDHRTATTSKAKAPKVAPDPGQLDMRHIGDGR